MYLVYPNQTVIKLRIGDIIDQISRPEVIIEGSVYEYRYIDRGIRRIFEIGPISLTIGGALGLILTPRSLVDILNSGTPSLAIICITK